MSASNLKPVPTEASFNFDFRAFGSYAVDREKEARNGVWIDIADASFLCLRAGGSNRRYQRAIQTAYFEIKKQFDDQTELNDALNIRAMEIFVDTALLNWRGVCDVSTGEEIPFSPEAARALLTEIPDLFDELQDRAQERERYLKDFVAEATDALGKS